MPVTSRVKDAHVHICVDDRTGLGTGVPGTANSNIGTATAVTHRAEKQRLLERFIMEHSLTATNTFSNNDAKNTNICTCNCNGCHEPRQIDYILSSDRSLRSRTFDSSATSSDPWGPTATIRERHGKALGKRHVRKPVGWVLAGSGRVRQEGMRRRSQWRAHWHRCPRAVLLDRTGEPVTSPKITTGKTSTKPQRRLEKSIRNDWSYGNMIFSEESRRAVYEMGNMEHISKEQPSDSFTSNFPQRIVRSMAKTKLADG